MSSSGIPPFPAIPVLAEEMEVYERPTIALAEKERGLSAVQGRQATWNAAA